MFTRILFEAIIVGVSAAIVGCLVSMGLMYYHDKTMSLTAYKFWTQIFFSFLLTGIILHLFFEYTGLNKVYCKKGNACLE